MSPEPRDRPTFAQIKEELGDLWVSLYMGTMRTIGDEIAGAEHTQALQQQQEQQLL